MRYLKTGCRMSTPNCGDGTTVWCKDRCLLFPTEAVVTEHWKACVTWDLNLEPGRLVTMPGDSWCSQQFRCDRTSFAVKYTMEPLSGGRRHGSGNALLPAFLPVQFASLHADVLELVLWSVAVVEEKLTSGANVAKGEDTDAKVAVHSHDCAGKQVARPLLREELHGVTTSAAAACCLAAPLVPLTYLEHHSWDRWRDWRSESCFLFASRPQRSLSEATGCDPPN